MSDPRLATLPHAAPRRPDVIVVEGVSKSFERGGIPVLRSASLTIRKGEVVALWGSSGSGKTTLLNIIGGLDTPDTGRVRVMGIDPTRERDRLRLRRECVGFVFQLHHLIPYLTVLENMLVPAIAAGKTAQAAGARVDYLLAQLNLEHRRLHRMQDLSGGERQRTAIGRALINEPAVLLADEPTGALDEVTGDQVFAMMCRLAREQGVTVVLATHERRIADACDRVLDVRRGQLHEIGA